MEELPHSLQIWDNAARLGLPPWLKAWLGFLVACFLGSLFFVRRHAAARWALGGFVFSHLLVVAIELSGVATLRTGLVSLTHVLGWTPAGIALLRELRVTGTDTRYGIWCRVLLAVIVVALVFDYRDAGLFLYHQLTGHPALAVS